MDEQLCTAAETALRAQTAAALQEYLEAAARIVFQEHLGLWRHPKERLKPAAFLAHGPDLSCHAPCTLWRRLSGRAKSVQGQDESVDDGGSSSSDAAITIATVSDYGLARTATYTSAAGLARAVLAELPEAARRLTASMHVRECDGLLLMTTRLQLSKQRAAGKLQCAQCGLFVSEGRGLRDHVQVKHKEDYGMAQAALGAARGAIVPRAPPGSAAALLCELWESKGLAARAEQRLLHPLLVAARDGHFGALVRALAHAGGVDDAHGGARTAAAPVDRASVDCLVDLLARDAAGSARAAEHVRRTRDKHGSTALHWAAGGGHVAVLTLLARLGISMSDMGGQKDGRTALHWAARNGHVAACRWLVEGGADPNATTHDGTSAIHWAVWRGELQVARYLVDEAGADLHAMNGYGCNAIQWAAQSDGGALLVCRWLRERGLDLKLLNRNGHSALHKAAVKGNAATCEWLLSAEGGLGEPHLRADADGNTPALMARLEGFTELADMIEAHAQACTA